MVKQIGRASGAEDPRWVKSSHFKAIHECSRQAHLTDASSASLRPLAARGTPQETSSAKGRTRSSRRPSYKFGDSVSNMDMHADALSTLPDSPQHSAGGADAARVGRTSSVHQDARPTFKAATAVLPPDMSGSTPRFYGGLCVSVKRMALGLPFCSSLKKVPRRLLTVHRDVQASPSRGTSASSSR